MRRRFELDSVIAFRRRELQLRRVDESSHFGHRDFDRMLKANQVLGSAGVIHHECGCEQLFFRLSQPLAAFREVPGGS
ncbi:hypothetical protein [Hansschlegelia sp. KR7-227]|uniref:hypothetical protein n=1 Tax=Hansschlegelia sp. KR7-227 TaxID=3400914 RepID=UPI003C064ABE